MQKADCLMSALLTQLRLFCLCSSWLTETHFAVECCCPLVPSWHCLLGLLHEKKTKKKSTSSPSASLITCANYSTHLLKSRRSGCSQTLIQAIIWCAQVAVSVLQPSSEVALQDYEAWLAGCILVKPRAPDIQAYPNAFQSGHTVFDVQVDFSNVGDVIVGILQNLDRAQKMVDRTTAMLKKHATPAQFAVDLDELLEMSIKESMGLE